MKWVQPHNVRQVGQKVDREKAASKGLQRMPASEVERLLRIHHERMRAIGLE